MKSMEKEQWLITLTKIEKNPEDIIEQIKKEFEENIQIFNQWKDTNFSINHKFEVVCEFSTYHLPILNIAAKYGFKNLTHRILKLDPELNITDSHNNTALLLSIKGNFTNIATILIERDADMEILNEKHEAPIHWACQNGLIELVKLLVNKIANVDLKDISGQTPLMKACANGHIDVVRYLIEENNVNFDILDNDPSNVIDEKDANIMYFMDEDLRKPIHYAALNGHLHILKYLIDEKNADFMDNIVLDLAATNGQLDIVKFLIDEKGVDCELKNYRNVTPLHVASENNRLNVVRYLIEEKHADTSIIDCDGVNILHASAVGGLETLRYLIEELNFDPNVGDYGHWTPLHTAVCNNHLNVVEYLGTKVDVNCKADCGWTPVLLAASKDFRLFKYLVEDLKGDFKAVTDMNLTALDYAANSGCLEIVRYLIEEKHCDANGVDVKGWTLLHEAVTGANVDIVDYLIKVRKLDFNIKNKNQMTPFALAVDYEKVDVIKYFLDNYDHKDIVDSFVLDLVKKSDEEKVKQLFVNRGLNIVNDE